MAAVHEIRHADDGGAEWRVAAAGEHENVKTRRACCGLPAWDKAAGFVRMVWRIGADDPRKAAHGLKVALALALCSVFYYVRPLYDFAGESAMWAVLTVVVVFEYTVGGCLYKGVNRAAATVTGGALAFAVQWIAGKSSKEFEPYIVTASLFVVAAAATYSRFIPTMKARFDYGVTVFILTYTLVAVSGYRVDEVLALAQNRLATVAIGAGICFAVCALVAPVWAGQELRDQVARSMRKVADAVEACVEDCFSSSSSSAEAAAAAAGDGGSATEDRFEAISARSAGYKAALNAKAAEDSLANLATWEPAHGRFGFRHPYPLYQKIGAATRSCAYSVDALAATKGQAPARVKKNMAGACASLSRHCAAVLREASGSVASMTQSGRLALLVDDMNDAAGHVREELRRLAVALEDSNAEHEQSAVATPALIEVLPLFTATSLLLEICSRAEGVVGAVDALATLARCKKADNEVDENTADIEAAVPIANPSADVPHAKVVADQEKAEMTTDDVSGQAPRDQAGKLAKVLTRRRSTKKWEPGEAKVSPQPPSDSAVHAPGPTSRSMELTNHDAQVVPSTKNRSRDLTAHSQASPSPRNRTVELATGHPPVATSPRNRAVDVNGQGPVVLTSPRNRSVDFAKHGPVLPSSRHRSILGMT